MSEYDFHYRSFMNRDRYSICRPKPYHMCPCPPRPVPCCCYCPSGPAGADGKSAYQIALDNGFVGTEAEWLESLKGETGPFLSSYLEAIGSTQRVGLGEDVAFDTDPDALDIAGNGIEINGSGTMFTITRAGLYHVEWSVNFVNAAAPPVVLGLLENGYPTSALTHTGGQGTISSGALINVTDADIPYTISLHNFTGPIDIQNRENLENTAASIRILRFADGEAR